MDVHDLAYIVEDFEAVDELATLLRVVQSRDHVRGELVFNAEVSLKMLVEELEKLLLQRFCSAALGEGEIFIIGKLAEVLGEDIFKVVQHLVESRDLRAVHKLLFLFHPFFRLLSSLMQVHLVRCFCFRLSPNFFGLFESLSICLLFFSFFLFDDPKLGFQVFSELILD